MQKNLIKAICRSIKGGPFAVTYWDGQTEVYGAAGGEEPSVKVIFNEKFDLREILQEPELKFGEAYMDGKIDYEGDLSVLFSLIRQNRDLFRKDAAKRGVVQRFMRCPKEVSSQKQGEDVQAHYDLGNDFFSMWLDKTMSYSCGYFKTQEDSLEQAQQQKIDHILRKMHLKKGETLLDIGCGWGCLIIKAAREYGVKALGITLGKEQEEETKRRIKEEGLGDMVEVRQADYRDLAVEGYTFDKIVNVGMFKHVGKEYIPTYFSCLNKMLKPCGLSLIHTITRPFEAPNNPWLEKYIFSWSYIPSLREIVWRLPQHSFHLIDVESLRIHYVLTHGLWLKNFEAASDQIKEKYGNKFYRMWHLYLAGCSASFRSSGFDIHQLLFSRDLCNEMPLTRDYLYR